MPGRRRAHVKALVACRRNTLALGLAVIFASLVLPLPEKSPAAPWAPPPGHRDLDHHLGERSAVPASNRTARRELARKLGPTGEVRTDRRSGGVAYVGRVDGLLTGPSKRPPREIVLSYLRDHSDVFGLDDRDIANLRLLARSVSPDGITHLRFNQVLDGILAFDSGVDGHVTADGRLINVSGAPVPGAHLPAVDPSLGPRAGLREARQAVGGETRLPATVRAAAGPARSTTFASGERAVLRWSATADGPRLVWSVLADDGDGRSYDVLIDAEAGSLIRRQDLTSDLGRARYFPADPLRTPDRIEIEMPPPWYDDHADGSRLWGQYSRTYIDADAANPEPGDELNGDVVQIPASSGTPDSPDWLYDPSTDFPGAAPCPPTGCTWQNPFRQTAEVNQFQAGTNAHVHVSRFHEHLKAPPIGFDEASGNFQRTNTSGSGLGSDYVRTEVNDGSGLNNANFMTPPDGIAPRMQMYLYSERSVNGSDMADVIYHEYTHGLSNRLVVNASGSSALSHAQSKMMGEGWSDFYGLDLLVHEGHLPDTEAPGEVVRGYYVNSPGGSRNKPIDCPVNEANTVAACNGTPERVPTIIGGYTYGDIVAMYRNLTSPPVAPWYTSPHDGGEFWAQTLWDIRTALGRDTALALITGGMRLSVDGPSMLDMRDAILQQAVATRSGPGATDDHYDELWEIFRRRGMGADATTRSAGSTAPAEGFSLVKAAGPMSFADPYPGGDNDGVIEPGEQIEIRQPLESVTSAPVTSISGKASGGQGTANFGGSVSWPEIGTGSQAANSDPLAVRLPATCTNPVPLTLSLETSAGPAKIRHVYDPRPGSAEVIPLADADGDVPGVTTASFEVTGSGTITDLDLRIDELRHSRIGDLRIELIHGDTTVVLLEGLLWAGQDIFDLVLDGAGADPVAHTGNPGPLTGRFQPYRVDGASPNALAAFEGLPVAGTWTLRITDKVEGEAGVLHRWGINSPQQACPGQLEIPAVQTAPATEVGRRSAVLRGSINPNGRETGMRFAYGPTANYGQTSAVVSVGAGDTAVPGTHDVSGLEPGTTYHYRVEAIREGGQVAVMGPSRTFTTATPTAPKLPAQGPPAGEEPPPQPPAQPALDRRPPRLTRASVRLSRHGPAGRARRIATFGFSVTERGRVTALVERRLRGFRVGRRCVAASKTRSTRGRRTCLRRVRVARAAVKVRRAGRGQLNLAGRGLALGSYTVTLTAIDAAGNRSKPVVRRFRVR